MLFQLKNYLFFLFRATNKHSIHSPFVFDLVEKCFEKKTDKKKSNILKKYKRQLLKDNSTINVTDFGAGSKVFTSNTRKVSAIAKNAGATIKNVELLVRLGDYFKFKNILEIGTSLGIGTLGLSLENHNTKITTLEGCPETLKIAKRQLTSFGINNVTYVTGDFNKTLETVLTKKYDLIYFDGNHQKEPTINYFEQCLKTKHNDSVFIFDDIHWSNGMNQAWNYIKNHKEVTLTIDTFYWGFVFFRKEQFEKEHFILRTINK
ncbi:MAG: class I SAM-dependent methyltransferase [Flavobacteriaceae bacterium]|nr:class I SAM-dependent methyltransferase [Flavobacteriaceae bacterium]